MKNSEVVVVGSRAGSPPPQPQPQPQPSPQLMLPLQLMHKQQKSGLMQLICCAKKNGCSTSKNCTYRLQEEEENAKVEGAKARVEIVKIKEAEDIKEVTDTDLNI
jgi:hypothetical protein